MKEYQVQNNIGEAKYVVSYHDGQSTHKDGSPFWGIRIFTNKVKLNECIKTLSENGYKMKEFRI